MIETALIESRKLLDMYIENCEDLDIQEVESIKHFIKALNVGCQCDDYNGYDCGCSHRAFLCDEALKELDLLKQLR